MCHLYPYNNVKLLRKFFYINFYKKSALFKKIVTIFVIHAVRFFEIKTYIRVRIKCIRGLLALFIEHWAVQICLLREL